MGFPSEGSSVVLTARQLCSAKLWLSWSPPPLVLGDFAEMLGCLCPASSEFIHVMFSRLFLAPGMRIPAQSLNAARMGWRDPTRCGGNRRGWGSLEGAGSRRAAAAAFCNPPNTSPTLSCDCGAIPKPEGLHGNGSWEQGGGGEEQGLLRAGSCFWPLTAVAPVHRAERGTWAQNKVNMGLLQLVWGLLQLIPQP